MKKVLLILLILPFSVVFSQFPDDALRYSTFNLGVGARAIGLGFAYIGVSDDYSSIFWNPAGLAQIRRFEFAGGLNYALRRNSTKVFDYSGTFENTTTNLNSVAFVIPVPTIRGSLVFAAGYIRVSDYIGALSISIFNSQSSIIPSLYDPDTKFDLAWNLGLEDSTRATQILGNVQQKISIYENGGLNHWFFSGAIDIAENLSVGTTLSVVSGSYKYDREFSELDERNFYKDFPWDFHRLVISDVIDATISGFSTNAGLMYRGTWFRIGLVTRFPSSLNVKENYSRSGKSYFDNGDSYSYSYSATSKYNVVSPFSFGAGLSFNLRNVVLIAGDVYYTDWRQMEFNNNPNLFSLNREIKEIFAETVSLSSGLEIMLPFLQQVKVRLGYSYRPSPYIEDKGILNRAERFQTFGFTAVLQKTLLLDFAYVSGKRSTFSLQYSYEHENKIYKLVTTEDVSLKNFVLTIRYRF